jgi:DNA-binding NarL/FixJ family response regulator
LKSDNEKIIFSVKDFGQGIPAVLHKKVFEPYYQITNVKRSNQGMGLGLPIVKKIVQGLSGDILLQNNLNEPGILLTVSLNKYVSTENEIVSADTKAKNFSLDQDSYITKITAYDKSKQNILIVEDNYSMANYLINKLATNYNVYSSENGDEALKRLRDMESLPDLIISDIMMDKVDGYEFAKIISNDPDYSHIPFVFLSAKSAKDDKLRGLRSGAIDFIQKPFNIHELLQKIESILTNVTKYKQALLTTALHNLKTRTNPGFKNSQDQFLKNCDFYRLTPREKDIVKLIHEGYNYKTIGATLFISERTVTKHVQNIFEKLDVSNKIKLINKLEAS